MSETKKYTFVVCSGISLHVDVEAKSLAEAMKLAQDSPIQGLCHQCARGDDGEWSTSGELDCDPASGELVSVYIDDEDLHGAEFLALVKEWS